LYVATYILLVVISEILDIQEYQQRGVSWKLVINN